jgi:hypothetical protein
MQSGSSSHPSFRIFRISSSSLPPANQPQLHPHLQPKHWNQTPALLSSFNFFFAFFFFDGPTSRCWGWGHYHTSLFETLRNVQTSGTDIFTAPNVGITFASAYQESHSECL